MTIIRLLISKAARPLLANGGGNTLRIGDVRAWLAEMDASGFDDGDIVAQDESGYPFVQRSAGTFRNE